jgi:hypothetical protein
MAEYSAEHKAQIARARRVQQAHESRLLDLPGVNGIGVSLKTVNGTRIPEFALVVHVTQKKPLAELPPGEQIPAEIEGAKTDVVVGGPFYALADAPGGTDAPQPDSTRYRPVRGGSMISPVGRSSARSVDGQVQMPVGTLGCVVVSTDPAITDPSKKYLLLTCSHVLFKPPSVTHTGRQVGQPDTSSACSKCLDNTVAHMDRDGLLSGYPPGSPPGPGPWVDAAVATLDPQTKWFAAAINTDQEGGIEWIIGTHKMEDKDVLFQFEADTILQQPYPVHKRGAVSGPTNGQVVEIGFTAQVHYEEPPATDPLVLTFNSVIRVVAAAGSDAFSAPGDSGSAVLNSNSEVIGLLFAGPAKSAFSYVVPICDVEDQLKVKVADSTTYPGEQTVPSPAAGVPAIPAVLQPAGQLTLRFAQVEEELRATSEGARLADTVRQHLPEIRSLVNTNRRVLVAWRRMEGPCWLEQGLRCLADWQQRFPAELAGRSLADCVAAFSGILQVHGSAQLATDAAWLGRLLPEFAGRSYEEILALLHSHDVVALAGDR